MKKIIILCIYLFLQLNGEAFALLKFSSNNIAEKGEINELPFIIVAEYLELGPNVLNSKEAIDKFNTAVKALSEKEAVRFKAKINELANSPKRMDYVASGKKSSLDIEMSLVAGSKKGPISIAARIDEFHPNYPHPSQVVKTINLDGNGDPIQLADIFAPEINYLEIISKYCEENLKLKIPNGLESAGYAPDMSNFQAWNFMHNGIAMNFNEGQVASKNKGTIFLVIPYSYLSQYLKKDISLPPSAPRSIQY